MKSFTEQDLDLAGPRALLTTRACWWAINQLRREHASVAGLARQLGTTWLTRRVYAQVPPRVEYELTTLGQTLLGPLDAVRDWAEHNVSAILDARDAHDDAHDTPQER